jgi:anti-anti-sigma factor
VALTEVQLMANRRAEESAEQPPFTARRTRYRDDLYVVTVTGELDLRTAPELARVMRGELPPVLVADLTRVTFLSAAGLRVLVDTAQRAGAAGRVLGLVAEGPLALRVLRMSGVAASIPTFESLSDAVRELAPKPDHA